MDGNGRWAQSHHQPRTQGHVRGTESVRRTVKFCRRIGVSALTLYTFSEQNWERPHAEVETLMHLLAENLLAERDEILSNQIRLCAIGRKDKLPSAVRELLNSLELSSAHHQGMTLNLALSYGGQEEIVDAAKCLAARVKSGELLPTDIDEKLFEQHVHGHHSGPVDLLIRTGGEQRISNFLLWSSAYAELHFSPTLWPDFRESDLINAIDEYQKRDRRFGRVKETKVNLKPQNIDPKGIVLH